jgi:hypothetical protein
VSLEVPRTCDGVLSVIELWEPQELLGEDRLIPVGPTGEPVVVTREWFPTTTTRRLRVAIYGANTSAGVPYADPWDGLEANINALRTAVVDPPSGTGLRAATLTMPSGAVRTADVRVRGLTLGKSTEGTNQITGEADVLVLATLALDVHGAGFV